MQESRLFKIVYHSFPESDKTPGQAYNTIVLRFPKNMSYRVYDEFDKTMVNQKENGDFIVSASMPEDEWHQLLLNRVHSNQNGNHKPFLPEPYNWKTYGDMNMEFWNKHQSTLLEDAKSMFQKSHDEVIKPAETFSNEELFSKGVYKRVGGSTPGSYFVSVTASHYDWAMKKLKAHRKNCAKM